MGSGSSVQRSNKANACQVKSASQSLNNQPSTANTQQAIPQLDKQLPFANYREWYSLKNFWKTIQRNKDQCAKILLLRFLTENAEFHPLYKKLSKVELTEEAAFNSNEFENMANQYLDVFDEAISAIESSPGDVSTAIDELMEVGRKHKAVPNMDASNFSKLESALLYMVQQILLDRFNEKCEDLFKKFFSFVVTNVTKGFNE